MTVHSTSSSSSSSSSTAAFITSAAAVAAVTAISLGILQSDAASRRFLSAKSLQLKRVKEYLHRWDWTLKKTLLRDCRLGRDQQMDKKNTEVFFKDDDIAEFITTTLLASGSNDDISIMSIEMDDDDHDYYVYMKQNSGDAAMYYYQLPLVKFGLFLADTMDNQLTTTTMCFIADTSSGLGTQLLTSIITESKAGVAVIQEPLWMALVANLAEKNIIGVETMGRILFGLCRLEAWRVREQVGSARTVAFTLPGQACTPALLPLLQTVFPCERHLFAYDGCINSVQRALYWRKGGNNNMSSSSITPPSNNNNNTTIIPFHNVITATTPMSRTSLTASIRTLADKLAKLPITLADTTETWMSSVDAFFRMKEDEATNDYLPYVLKLSLLVNDESLDDFDSTRRLALTNVLQFVTGSRSRPIPEAVLDAAVESLRDFTNNNMASSLPSKLSSKQCALIEDAVFQHKSILIENKTLMDTVMPQKEWTLKAAKKISGCACCAPDPDEEEELSNVAKQEANRSRPNYVDGKMGFAFDPTRFG